MQVQSIPEGYSWNVIHSIYHILFFPKILVLLCSPKHSHPPTTFLFPFSMKQFLHDESGSLVIGVQPVREFMENKLPIQQL